MQGPNSGVVECVPNFSEGRDLSKIKQITNAIEAIPGVSLLDVDSGADTNRTVVTFAGTPDAALEAAFQAIKTASQVLDMSTHKGAHPRIGATDVCPFVPVAGLTLEDCAELARRLAERVGRELRIPVYLYESAATKPERKNLAVVRKGEYEGLRQKLKDPDWKPDFGPSEFNAKTGATIIGAREFLIAYNITLNSRDKAHATDIAFELREKGRVARRNQSNAFFNSGDILFYREGKFPCGNCDHDAPNFDALETHCKGAHGYDLPHLLALNEIDATQSIHGKKAYRAGRFKACKAIGWFVEAYGRAQLSINLTDFTATPTHLVLEATRILAAERGLVVTGSEIVGLVPYPALYQSGQHYLRAQGKSPFIPSGDILKTAIFSLGLADVAPFDLDKKVIGLPKASSSGLMAMTGKAFVDEVSRDTPAPGGGSIAALAGSLGAALASMVANLTQGNPGVAEAELLAIAQGSQATKDALVIAVDEDTAAFNGYMEALRLPKNTDEEKAARGEAMQAGLKAAVAVPWATAQASLEAMRLCERVMAVGNPNSLTDGMVGCVTAFAGVRGGIWNVLINLKDIKDSTFVSEMRNRCDALLAESRELLGRTSDEGDRRLAEMIESKHS